MLYQSPRLLKHNNTQPHTQRPPLLKPTTAAPLPCRRQRQVSVSGSSVAFEANHFTRHSPSRVIASDAAEFSSREWSIQLAGSLLVVFFASWRALASLRLTLCLPMLRKRKGPVQRKDAKDRKDAKSCNHADTS